MSHFGLSTTKHLGSDPHYFMSDLGGSSPARWDEDDTRYIFIGRADDPREQAVLQHLKHALEEEPEHRESCTPSTPATPSKFPQDLAPSTPSIPLGMFKPIYATYEVPEHSTEPTYLIPASLRNRVRPSRFTFNACLETAQ